MSTCHISKKYRQHWCLPPDGPTHCNLVGLQLGWKVERRSVVSSSGFLRNWSDQMAFLQQYVLIAIIVLLLCYTSAWPHYWVACEVSVLSCVEFCAIYWTILFKKCDLKSHSLSYWLIKATSVHRNEIREHFYTRDCWKKGECCVSHYYLWTVNFT